MAEARPDRWPLTVWLEVPRDNEPTGWLRVLCLGTYRTAAELPPGEELDARAERLGERHGLTGRHRRTIDFNGGATRPR